MQVSLATLNTFICQACQYTLQYALMSIKLKDLTRLNFVKLCAATVLSHSTYCLIWLKTDSIWIDVKKDFWITRPCQSGSLLTFYSRLVPHFRCLKGLTGLVFSHKPRRQSAIREKKSTPEWRRWSQGNEGGERGEGSREGRARIDLPPGVMDSAISGSGQ